MWDWAAGRNFVTAMSDALDRRDRVLALFSPGYFDRSRYTTGEWSAAMAHVRGTLLGIGTDGPTGELAAALAARRGWLVVFGSAIFETAYGPDHHEVTRTRAYLDAVQQQLGDQ